mgnify:CR=1 FL=1
MKKNILFECALFAQKYIAERRISADLTTRALSLVHSRRKGMQSAGEDAGITGCHGNMPPAMVDAI